MARTRATALVKKGNHILMIYRFNNGKEYWVLPGGGLEEGETLEEAALRELKEETSMNATIEEKAMDFIDDRGDRHVLFLCNYLSGEPKLDENSTEAQNTDQSYIPQWVDIKRINDLVIYPVKQKEYLCKNYKR